MEKKCAITLMKEVASKAGWTCEDAYDWVGHETNKRALQIGDYRYFTLVSPDGAVKIALSNNLIYVREGRGYVNLGDPSEFHPDYMTISGITTDPSQRKQGKATSAMKQLLQWAQQCGIVKIRLEPCRITSLIGSKRKSDAPNEKTLAKWYQSLGFRQLYEGRNIILTTEQIEDCLSIG